jgi:ubiquitin-protein ligase
MRTRLGAAFEGPWQRRLRKDLREMEALRKASTVLDFEAFGDPPDRYVVTFKGRGLVKQDGELGFTDRHQVEIKLHVEYPRRAPEMRWLTPIHHPNIWGQGTVCLRDFWSPMGSRLVDAVAILWDMARLQLLNPRSAYTGGVDARTEWTELEERFGPFPVDRRAIDDLAEPAEPEKEGPPDIEIMGRRPRRVLGRKILEWAEERGFDPYTRVETVRLEDVCPVEGLRAPAVDRIRAELGRAAGAGLPWPDDMPLPLLADDGQGGYAVLDGYRRLAAAALAGLRAIPALVVSGDTWVGQEKAFGMSGEEWLSATSEFDEAAAINLSLMEGGPGPRR